MHTIRHITTLLAELICFHLPSVSSNLVFAAERSFNPSFLYLLTGFRLSNQLTAAAAAVAAFLAFLLQHQVKQPKTTLRCNSRHIISHWARNTYVQYM